MKTQSHIHIMRKKIDKIIQDTERTLKVGRYENSDNEQGYFEIMDKAEREISIVRIKLEEAKMWYGKALGALGSELPQKYADKADK